MKSKKNKAKAEPVCEQEELCAQQKFLNSLKAAESAYVYVLVISGILLGGAISIAVLFDVFAGLAVGIASVILYMLLTKNILDRTLGLSYTSNAGSVTITAVKGKGREEIFIPSSLIRTTVAELGAHALSDESCSCIKVLHLPSTLTEIGAFAFDGCPSLKQICFEGSESEWEKIDCRSDISKYEITFNDPSHFKIQKHKDATDITAKSSREDSEVSTAEEKDK